MPRIQLLADSEYFTSFSSYLTGIEGVELVGQSPDILFDAIFLNPESKLTMLSKLDSNHSLVISNTLTVSATTAQSAAGRNYRVVGMPIFPNYFTRQSLVEYSLPLGAEHENGEVLSFLTQLGKTGERVSDAVAGVFPRTLAMIINEAAFAVQEGIATAKDIDVAMKLGTNYPMGPLAWCDEIGAAAIVSVLDALAKEYGSERYKVAPILRRNAEAHQTFYPTTIEATA